MSLRLPFVLLLFSMLFLSCNKKEDAPVTVDAELVVSPVQLFFNDNESKTISLSLQPRGSYSWEITAKPDWLELSETSGTINNQIVTLTVTSNTEGLDAGLYSGSIDIITNGAGKGFIAADLFVAGKPVAEVNPTEILFTETEDYNSFTISNTGTGYLNWTLEDLPDWLNVDRSEGTLIEDESESIYTTVDRENLAPGTYTETVNLLTNASSDPVPITFTMNVGTSVEFDFSKDTLYFNLSDSDQYITLYNTGNSPSSWSQADADDAPFTLSPSSGTLAGGDSVQIRVTVDRSNLDYRVNEFSLTFTTPEGVSATLPVQVVHFEETKWLLNDKIADAEYDTNNDVIVAITQSSRELVKYDPITQTATRLSLNVAPLCVGVSPDGKRAVVGNDGSVTMVDLENMTIERAYTVGAEVFDIILAANDWVYIFPEQDQWTDLLSFNSTEDNPQVFMDGVLAGGTYGRLHPSGDYIYTTESSLYSDYSEKYDIRNGRPTGTSFSPYLGDYSIDGNLWLSEEGDRIFARSGNIFLSDENIDRDFTYAGKLYDERGKYIIHLDHSTAANRIYAIVSSVNGYSIIGSNKVEVYEPQYYQFLKTRYLPSFFVNTGSGEKLIESEGIYGFINSDGTKYHAIVKGKTNTPVSNDWAIVTLDVE